jgi:hypothetical protein
MVVSCSVGVGVDGEFACGEHGELGMDRVVIECDEGVRPWGGSRFKWLLTTLDSGLLSTQQRLSEASPSLWVLRLSQPPYWSRDGLLLHRGA